MTHRGPFQLLLFCDSVILSGWPVQIPQCYLICWLQMSLTLLSGSAQLLLRSHWWERELDYGLKTTSRLHSSMWFPLGQSVPFSICLKCCTSLLNRSAQALSFAFVHAASECASSHSFTSKRGLIHHVHWGEKCCPWHKSVNISLANSYCWWRQVSLCHKDTSVLLERVKLQATLCQRNCVSDNQCKNKGQRPKSCGASYSNWKRCGLAEIQRCCWS